MVSKSTPSTMDMRNGLEAKLNHSQTRTSLSQWTSEPNRQLLVSLSSTTKDMTEKLVSKMESHTSESGEVLDGNLRRLPPTSTVTISGTPSSLLSKQAKDRTSTWTASRSDGSSTITLTLTGREPSESDMPLT